MLGRHTPVMQEYSPHILHPISRAEGRQALGLSGSVPFHGVDLWHAYELSWLDASGKPVVRVGRFSVPADSSNMIESKSFKLYLNSLNNCHFASEDRLRTTVIEDISSVARCPVELELMSLDDPLIAGVAPAGECLDQLDIPPAESGAASSLLKVNKAEVVEEKLYSHVLRSLCPVTGQPDWATLWLAYRGPKIDHASLLSYLLGYRRHQEFHEQCVERIFCDISAACAPSSLTVQALYTRRGGLDICPLRSTDPGACHLGRLDRQ